MHCWCRSPIAALQCESRVQKKSLKLNAIIEAVDIFFCRFAGVVVFSIIGFKATNAYEACKGRVELHKTNEECSIEKELSESVGGTGLAFIIFTEAINQFPLANLWAILFFLMLFTLGIDSQFGTLEGVISSLVDMKLFPNLPKNKITMVSYKC